VATRHGQPGLSVAAHAGRALSRRHPGLERLLPKDLWQDFDRCTAEQKETFLKDIAAGKITLDGGLPGRAFFAMFYENVMEGLFADPIYGGNKDKAGWKMIGFPGRDGQQRGEHQEIQRRQEIHC